MELETTIGDIILGDRDVFPPYLYAAYRSSILRAPTQRLIDVPLTISEQVGPGPALSEITPEDADLTRNAATGGEALGQRIIVTGRVADEHGAPVPDALIEIWQANAAGRYLHQRDQWPAPIDPNFLGVGRCHTDASGHYRFLSIRPGAYPWRNHPNAWRPSHIHFSLFGTTWLSRLVTQMYFPDDPLHAVDPILSSVPEPARPRLIARYRHDITEPEWALGYAFDIVLSGPNATPFEPPRVEAAS
ncbi:MAG TPA: protocatechuate 3,4-dioxygenase subunit beta [Thermomicrobiales bacterium]|nr:protocatechuate 3,4-dioxygenase subunit beta [Thermomicrobiales bacterium]